MMRKFLPLALLVLSAACTPSDGTSAEISSSSSSSRVTSSVQAVVSSKAAGIPSQTSSAKASVSSKAVLQASVLLDVPFTVQAPFANWDAVHEETCEEASLLMVQRYLAKKTSIGAQEAEDELQKMVKWQTDNGYSYDVTMAELLKTAKGVYGLNGYVDDNVTVEHIKELLQGGHPIIIPAAGRQLGNPYFSGAGPWYHVLVIVGYDGKNFITNDPGTKRGEGYKYSYDTIISVIHDWTGVKEDIASGPKRMLVVTD